jgi:outer membrane lipopolysaccharide assembly protein LptE/RlpB
MRVRVVITSLFLFIIGCGYSFQGGGTSLPSDVKRIQIPTVENLSTESGLTQLLTESLRDQFERFAVVSIVDDAAEADAVLKIRIIKVNRKTKTTTGRTDTAQQFDTALTVGGELRRVTGALLWSNPSFEVSKTVGATGNVVVSSSSDFAEGGLGASDLASLDSREVVRGQEQEALEKLSVRVARKIYDDSVAPDF